MIRETEADRQRRAAMPEKMRRIVETRVPFVNIDGFKHSWETGVKTPLDERKKTAEVAESSVDFEENTFKAEGGKN